MLPPGTLNKLLQLASSLWNKKRFQEAIDQLEGAIRRDPANPILLLNLARMHGFRYHLPEAHQYFERAISITPKKAETLLIAGKDCRGFGRYDLAERYFLRGAEIENAPAQLFVELAKLYELTRRPEAAFAILERNLSLNPKDPESILVKARLERQNDQLDESERTIRTILSSPPADIWLHAQGWYELGAILDRQGKYDEAMSTFSRAKSILQPHMRPMIADYNKVRDHLSQMQEGLTYETIQRWLNTSSHLNPPRKIALLGGHPRSGTTLLEQVLDAHPQIIALEETTIFFDDSFMPLAHQMPEGDSDLEVLDSAPTNAILRSRETYFQSAASFLTQPIGERLLVDKNPSLTFLIPHLIRIFPEVKLLIALRDPRDVVISCFMQPLQPRPGNAAYLTLETAVEEYLRMMNSWRKLKPMLAGRFLEIRYEDLVDDLETTAHRALDFLEMIWDHKVLAFDAHARQRLVRSPTYADVTLPVYKHAKGRWQNYEKYLTPHLSKLEPILKNFRYI